MSVNSNKYYFEVRDLRKVVPIDIPELKGASRGSKSFGERVLFEKVSFELDRGEVLAIEGKSGCGKTSLLRIISGLDRSDGGDVYLMAKTPKDFGLPEWRTRVAYVGQARVNFEGSPRDLLQTFSNLAAQAKLKKSRAKEEKEGQVSYEITLEDLVSDWKLSPEMLDNEWSRLSGGEYQRMALAVAIALKPDVLLLDEPTSALDKETTDAVEKTLCSLPIPKLWITHDSTQAQRVGHYHLKFPGPVLSKITRDKIQESS